MRWSSLILSFSVIGSLLILFLLIPLISLFTGISLNDLMRYGLSEDALNALCVALAASSMSTLILLLSGIPISYVIARKGFAGRDLVRSLLDLPLVIPHGVAGIAILGAYNSRAPLGSLIAEVGIFVEDSFWGIVAVMCFVSAPLMVDTLVDGFLSVDQSLEHVARSLGASEWRAFSSVTLPLASRSVVTASLMSWARGISEVGAILIVAYYPKSINVLIMDRFWTYGLEAAKATALPLLAISMACFILLKRLSGRK
ncbi:MAG: ABC transporter permease [Candidatus Korarchaeum sp.]|nr:ABC transporter permease [Candidatus Korarchaeum sp.]MDW8035645.1 ABC transporter permease [Candidatus Korarchaeum sp.]